MSTLARATLPIALLASLAACKSNNIKSSEENAYVTETVGTQGATLTLDDGASVYIPSEALAQSTSVTLGRVGSGYPPFNGYVASGPVYSLEPHGLTFQVAASLSVPQSQGSTLLFAPENGGWMDLKAIIGAGKLTAQSTQGGFFAAVAGGASVADGGGKSGGPNGTSNADGQLVRSGLGVEGYPMLAIGDTHVFYVEQSVDQFGAQTTVLQAAPLDSMNAPTTLGMLGSMAGQGNLAASGDSAYWVESAAMGGGAPGGPGSSIYRGRVGSAPEVIGTTNELGGFSVAEGSVLFINANKQLTLYDTATGKLDPTAYGSVDAQASPMGGAPFTRSEDHVFFLTGGGTSPFEVWAGPIGSPATDTGINFPGSAMLMGIGATGGTLIILTAVGSQENVIAFDTENPMGPQTIGSFGASGGGGGQSAAIAGGAVYAATYASGGSTGDLIKINVADGKQTKVGTYVAQGSPRPLRVNTTNVFVLQPSQSGMGSDLYQWAR